MSQTVSRRAISSCKFKPPSAPGSGNLPKNPGKFPKKRSPSSQRYSIRTANAEKNGYAFAASSTGSTVNLIPYGSASVVNSTNPTRKAETENITHSQCRFQAPPSSLETEAMPLHLETETHYPEIAAPALKNETLCNAQTGTTFRAGASIETSTSSSSSAVLETGHCSTASSSSTSTPPSSSNATAIPSNTATSSLFETGKSKFSAPRSWGTGLKGNGINSNPNAQSIAAIPQQERKGKGKGKSSFNCENQTARALAQEVRLSLQKDSEFFTITLHEPQLLSEFMEKTRNLLDTSYPALKNLDTEDFLLKHVVDYRPPTMLSDVDEGARETRSQTTMKSTNPADQSSIRLEDSNPPLAIKPSEDLVELFYWLCKCLANNSLDLDLDISLPLALNTHMMSRSLVENKTQIAFPVIPRMLRSFNLLRNKKRLEMGEPTQVMLQAIGRGVYSNLTKYILKGRERVSLGDFSIITHTIAVGIDAGLFCFKDAGVRTKSAVSAVAIPAGSSTKISGDNLAKSSQNTGRDLQNDNVDHEQEQAFFQTIGDTLARRTARTNLDKNVVLKQEILSNVPYVLYGFALRKIVHKEMFDSYLDIFAKNAHIVEFQKLTIVLHALRLTRYDSHDSIWEALSRELGNVGDPTKFPLRSLGLVATALFGVNMPGCRFAHGKFQHLVMPAKGSSELTAQSSEFLDLIKDTRILELKFRVIEYLFDRYDEMSYHEIQHMCSFLQVKENMLPVWCWRRYLKKVESVDSESNSHSENSCSHSSVNSDLYPSALKKQSRHLDTVYQNRRVLILEKCMHKLLLFPPAFLASVFNSLSMWNSNDRFDEGYLEGMLLTNMKSHEGEHQMQSPQKGYQVPLPVLPESQLREVLQAFAKELACKMRYLSNEDFTLVLESDLDRAGSECLHHVLQREVMRRKESFKVEDLRKFDQKIRKGAEMMGIIPPYGRLKEWYDLELPME